MLSQYDDKVISLVLRERQTAFSRYLAGRLRHALITGSTMDERNSKTFKRMFWGVAIVVAVFAFNAGDAFLGTSPRTPESGLSSEFFVQFAMTAFFALLLFINHVVLVGLRNKEKVPVDLSIPPFNREAAMSGGIWAAAGMGLIALFSYLLG